MGLRQGAAPTAGGRKTTAQPLWHKQTVDALAAAQRSYSPELAMQAVAVMEWLPELHGELAKFYEALGKRSVEMVDLPSGTASFFASLGGQMRRQHNALATGMAAAKKSVQDRIDRVVRGRKQDEAWDVKKHRDGKW